MPVTNPVGKHLWTATATVKRLNVSTGVLDTITTVTGTLQPAVYRPYRDKAPYREGDYQAEYTDNWICDAAADIQANDVLVISGEEYHCRNPYKYSYGRLKHQTVPVSAYTPGT